MTNLTAMHALKATLMLITSGLMLGVTFIILFPAYTADELRFTVTENKKHTFMIIRKIRPAKCANNLFATEAASLDDNSEPDFCIVSPVSSQLVKRDEFTESTDVDPDGHYERSRADSFAYEAEPRGQFEEAAEEFDSEAAVQPFARNLNAPDSDDSSPAFEGNFIEVKKIRKF